MLTTQRYIQNNITESKPNQKNEIARIPYISNTTINNETFEKGSFKTYCLYNFATQHTNLTTIFIFTWNYLNVYTLSHHRGKGTEIKISFF